MSLPSWLLAMACFWIPVLLIGFDQAFATERGLQIMAIFIPLGIAIAWAWWSFAAPRWRLWAYRRAGDLLHLERLAVADRLVWPVSHPFTRTEFRVGQLGRRLSEFEVLLRKADVR